MISNEEQPDLKSEQEQKEKNDDDISENKPIEKISNISKPTINNVSIQNA